MHSPIKTWRGLQVKRENFDLSALESLLAGEVASVVIDDFYPKAACSALVDNIQRRGLKKTFCGKNLEATSSGLSAIDYKDKSEAEYLDDVPLAKAERRLLLGDQTDPTDMVLALLGRVWHAGAALASQGDRSYFAGVIRILTRAFTHNDWVPRDLKNWITQGITGQLSWHIYLSIPDAGGEFQVWRRDWKEEDEDLYKLPGVNQGYDEKFLMEVPMFSELPAVGRFVLFDTRNYHAFLDVPGDKECLVISSFLSVTDESQPLLFW